MCCNEEEKQYFQEELERKHEIINDLKIEIENWKSKYFNILIYTIKAINNIKECFYFFKYFTNIINLPNYLRKI